MKKTIGALALLMMAAAPLRAQEHSHGQMQGHGGMPEMAMKMHRSHAAIEHRQQLGLNDDQVRRLTAVDSAQMAAMREHCRQVTAAGGPSAQTHARMHPAMMASVEGFQRQVDAILTAPQKAQLDSMIAAHHGPGGHDMAAMHAQHGGAQAQAGNHAAHAAGGEHAEHGDGHDGCPIAGCTDAECCRMMNCDEKGHGEHAAHGAHTAG